jgi:hypothetical protein
MNTNELAFEQLNRLVGFWNTTGKISGTGLSPSIDVNGIDRYEWLPGGHFLLHQADVYIGKEKSHTHEIIGYDQAKKIYTMQYYNSQGDSGFMTATVVNDVWMFTGETLRFNGGFSLNDSVFSGIWEQRNEDGNWAHLMDIKLTRNHSV